MKYFNNAGAGLSSSATIEVFADYLNFEVEVGGYVAASRSSDKRDKFYSLTAELLGCKPEEVAFCDSASRAWNIAISGVSLEHDDRIVTLSSEFGTNLVSLFRIAALKGAQVIVIPVDEAGNFDFDVLSKEIENPSTKLVAISHVAAHASIVNPVVEIGNLVASRAGVVYLVDGCQAVGQIEVDVTEIQCDAYTGTSRKWLRGPRGAGFLFVRQGAPLVAEQVDLSSADLVFSPSGAPSGVEIREDARQFELWERSVGAELALTNAIDEFLRTGRYRLPAIAAAANTLRRAVHDSPRLRLLGALDSSSGVVGFVAPRDATESLRARLDAAGFIAGEMHDWDCPLHFPRDADVIFRLSPHYYTSESDVRELAEILRGFD